MLETQIIRMPTALCTKDSLMLGGGKKVYHTYCVRKSENGKWFVGLTFMGCLTEKQSMIQRAFKVSGYFDNPEEAQNNLDWYARDNVELCWVIIQTNLLYIIKPNTLLCQSSLNFLEKLRASILEELITNIATNNIVSEVYDYLTNNIKRQTVKYNKH